MEFDDEVKTCYVGCTECDGCYYLSTEESNDKTTWYPICTRQR